MPLSRGYYEGRDFTYYLTDKGIKKRLVAMLE